MSIRAIWISWEQHRRTRSIVAAMNIPMFEFHSHRGRWLRHPYFILRTIGTLLREHPNVLIVQNPSILLTMLAICLRPLLRYRLVVDAHNAGVYACDAAHKKYSAIYPFFHRHADLTVVTNSQLANIVACNGGRPFELIDPLPNFASVGEHTTPDSTTIDHGQLARVTYICTYAADEPFEEVFAAAALLLGEVEVRVTGNVDAHRHTFSVKPPENIVFTGFLPDADFIKLLRESDCIIDLTTLPDCLVCGGYEAAALGVPLVVSDSPANRQIFTPGAVLASNCAEDLARAVLIVLQRREEVRRDMVLLKNNLSAIWDRQFYQFGRWLAGECPDTLISNLTE